MKINKSYIGTIIVSIFVGIIGTMCVYKLIPNNEGKEKVVSNVNVTEADSLNSSIGKINDAVVYIASYQRNQLAGSGTGFFYKKDNNKAYIMTNNHVVANSQKVEITTTSGKSYEANVVGTDEYADIAVLTVDLEACSLVATLGESNQSKIGDTIFTVGSPLGIEYMNTVTKGILSGKDRTVEVSYSNGDSLMEVLQIDAAINPGNSGGPLLNSNGEVIGVNSLKLVENEVEGMGFAIAIENVEKHLSDLELGKQIERPYLGISMLNVGDTYALYNSGIVVDSKITSGVVVVDVASASSVDKVLKKGDIITKIDNEKVDNLAYLRYELYKHNIGDKIKITYIRNNKEYTSEVILKTNK